MKWYILTRLLNAIHQTGRASGQRFRVTTRVLLRCSVMFAFRNFAASLGVPAASNFSCMLWHRRVLRKWLLPILILVGTMIAARLGGQLVYRNALEQQAVEASASLAQRAEALDRYIDRYRIMPAVLSLDPQLRTALENSDDDSLRRRASERLLQLNFSNRTGTLTLIDRHGVAIAASNWQSPASNVGHSFGFRPYFYDAMTKGDGEFYAIGTTTGVPGYFIARAIHDDSGTAIGAVSVKVELETIEVEWEATGKTLLLSDANDIVFLATRPAWRYRVLAQLSDEQKVILERTHQYSNQPLLSADVRTKQDIGAGVRLIDIRAPRTEDELLWLSRELPREGWRLQDIEDTRKSRQAAWIGTAVSGGAWLLLVAVAIVVWQRHRITSVKLRGELKLQQLVEHHAIALRTAQDGVLQAAREAALGQTSSLEHLPQGVSVIDKDLNLVAWNRRYAELFGYPTDLLVVGRPIVDLIRYNSRHGFLGADPSEEAIQRRLNRLRSGQPHLHERTSPDGTVVEIRGNPLPDGGFVTSYVDITTYQQAARELRTMVDSLEQGIRQRTRDLQTATSAAERASRSKSRFVAAAVHDLLQPLNAARLYLRTLRDHVDTSVIEPLDHINAALATQEDILSSLLDIARLESGTFEVRIATFRLAHLLDSLENQFRPVAAARQLELHFVRTRTIIRSDEVLLRRVIQNFLSNALKFARPGGRVLVGCRRRDRCVRIEIWDTGPGIPEDKRETIFEEFQRLDNYPAHGNDPRITTHGAGLGLAIVRQIARLLDHCVTLRSWPGRGSVFSIDVPLGQAGEIAAQRVDDDHEATFRDRRIWIVDDDPHSLHAATALLQTWGCDVRLLHTLAETTTACAASPPPELLLLDYRLGETTGFDLGAQLCEVWGTLPPVILVSADAHSNLRARCQELGWGFLPKPLRPGALRALMARMLERTVSI